MVTVVRSFLYFEAEFSAQCDYEQLYTQQTMFCTFNPQILPYLVKDFALFI